MMKQSDIKLFGNKTVCSVWDNEKEEWYFSFMDVVAAQADGAIPQACWRVLKKDIFRTPGSRTARGQCGCRCTEAIGEGAGASGLLPEKSEGNQENGDTQRQARVFGDSTSFKMLENVRRADNLQKSKIIVMLISR